MGPPKVSSIRFNVYVVLGELEVDRTHEKEGSIPFSAPSDWSNFPLITWGPELPDGVSNDNTRKVMSR